MAQFTVRRIMVPINGSPTDGEAVRLGCRLARRARAKVYVVAVLEVRRALPLSETLDVEVEPCERLLDRAEAIGAELDVDIETEVIQAREAGPAIVDEISEWQADLVIVGMPWRERFGDFYMGRTAPYVLRNAPCRVILFREPPPDVGG